MPSYGGFDSTIEVLAKFYPMMMMLITQYSLVPAFSEIKRDFLFDPNRDVYSSVLKLF